MIGKILKYLSPLLLVVPYYMMGASDDQKIFYVSSSIGNDLNEGTEESPLKSLSSSKITKGAMVKLKCGDVFYESVKAQDIDYSSYGEGSKPVISGWKILPKGNSMWSEGKLINGRWESLRGTHIWRLDLMHAGFYGRINSPEQYENNIGLILEKDSKRMHGRKCEFLYKEDCNDPHKNPQRNTYLKKNFDFAQTSKLKGNLQPSDFRYLYMYLDHDPSQHELMFSTYGNGVSARNTHISNLCIEGFGSHGIACGSNVTISDCDVEYIGGAQHLDMNTKWTRYGNGIEFYVSKTRENGRVYNNNIAYTFDCATTIQGSKHVGATAKNIIIENNIIRNCRQAFEFFLSNSDKGKNITYDCEKCIFRNNVCIDSGENGFECPEYRDTHILSYQKEYSCSMLIEGNVFIGGHGLYTAQDPTMLRLGKNEYYYSDDMILWQSGTPKEVVMLKNKKSLGKGEKSVESVVFHRVSQEQLNVKRKELTK